jgi:hypothetical protein
MKNRIENYGATRPPLRGPVSSAGLAAGRRVGDWVDPHLSFHEQSAQGKGAGPFVAGEIIRAGDYSGKEA